MSLAFNPKEYSNYVDILKFWCRKQPNKEMYRFIRQDGSTTWLSYSQVLKQAESMASAINKKIAPGERVVLIYPPGIELIVALWGCFISGRIAIPVYPPVNESTIIKLCNIAKNADPTLLLMDGNLKKKWLSLKGLKCLGRLPFIKNFYANDIKKYSPLLNSKLLQQPILTHQLAIKSHPVASINVSGDSIAYLQYTSGSTGEPKGVMVSHRNLVAQTSLNFQHLGMDNNTRMVSWLPPYHDLGLVGALFLPILGGGSAILMSPIHFLKKPSNWLKAISDYHATISGGPPFAYDLVVRKTPKEQLDTFDLSSWKYAFIGAEPIQPRTLFRFLNFLKQANIERDILVPGYGLAETTLTAASRKGGEGIKVQAFCHESMKNKQVVAVENSAKDVVLLTSNGSPYEKIKIVEPQNKRVLSEGKIGEIWVQGESVTKGYWQRTEETHLTFMQTLDNIPGYWCRTGDLGFILDGELFVTSRIKDLIIIKGLNYYPQDIEETVSECHENIRKGCVAAFMIKKSNEEGLAVAVEIKNEAEYQTMVDTILQQVGLKHGVSIDELVLLKPRSLPKTTSGKIARAICQQNHANNLWNALFRFTR